MRISISSLILSISCIIEAVTSTNCDGTYLAPSTIKEAGTGIYAARDYKAGESFPLNPTIPVFYSDYEEVQFSNTLISHFTWSCPSLNGNSYHQDKYKFECLMVNEGGMVNHHLWTYVNIIPVSALSYAMMGDTAYSTSRFVATKDIAAGDELFTSYGPHW